MHSRNKKNFRGEVFEEEKYETKEEALAKIKRRSA